MTKCSNCGEEIDGPAYNLESDPDEPLCSHCHRAILSLLHGSGRM